MEGLAFYEAAAQVIVLLLIVVGVEVRVFDRPRGPWSERLFFAVVVWVLTGELAALIVLWQGDPSTVFDIVIWSALILELGLMGAVALPADRTTGRPRVLSRFRAEQYRQ